MQLPSQYRRIISLISRTYPVRKLRHLQKRAFTDKYLLWTNLFISISLSTVGDCLEQKYEIYTGDINKYSRQRTEHMAISGGTVGVVCHFWYKFLDKRLPERTLRVVAKKVVLDQFICSPIVISTFFLTLGVLEQSNKTDIIEEIKQKAWKLYAAEWVVWPPAQIINFLWLPTKYRVLYDNTISLGYDVFTSKVKHERLL